MIEKVSNLDRSISNQRDKRTDCSRPETNAVMSAGPRRSMVRARLMTAKVKLTIRMGMLTLSSTLEYQRTDEVAHKSPSPT